MIFSFQVRTKPWSIAWGYSGVRISTNVVSLAEIKAKGNGEQFLIGSKIWTKTVRHFLVRQLPRVDFLCKLGIKPHMGLLEISTFSQNNVIVRLTKIMNHLGKDLKILIFKVIFQHQKLVDSFQKKISVKNIWLGEQLE